MKIAVLDYSCNSVDIVTVSQKTLDEYSDEEDYLINHCGYNLDEVKWMIGDDIEINTDMDHDSFGG